VPRRRLVGGLALAGAAALAAARRRRARAGERVDLFFADGATLSLGNDTEVGRDLLGVARTAVERPR
jgi:hypothetical protein